MNNSKQCVVVFPVYRTLFDMEYDCLLQAVKMTEGFPKVFVAPQSLDIDESFGDLRSLPVVRFDDKYFAGLHAYNELMLSLEFYQRFADSDYILIHQTDAYLFKPELARWCETGYDYIGAPWYKPYKRLKTLWNKFLLNILPFTLSKKRKIRYSRYNNVGNGGLSLRKTASFINILNLAPDSLMRSYRSNRRHLYNEDLFWSLSAPKLMKTFRKPGLDEALHFAFETYPKESYRKIGNQLPFGCHAFDVHGREFWQHYLPVRTRKRVLIDLCSIDNLSCGFGQICLNYNRIFGAMNPNDIEFQFLVTDTSNDHSGKRYLSLRDFNRMYRRNFSELNLFHITNQQRTYKHIPTNIPVVLTIHDLNFLYEKTPLKIQKYMQKVNHLLQYAQAVVTISHFVAEEIRRHFDLQGKELRVIYNGVERIDHQPDRQPTFVRDNRRPFFFTIGQVRTKKNFHVLLDVMKAFPDHDLYIAGESHRTYAKHIRQRIDREAIPNVFLTGIIPNRERIWLYRHCAAFLFPSRYEGFGLPVIEAMQFGKAVFSSPTTSLTEICGGHAFLWEEDFDPQKMIRLIRDNLPGFYDNPARIEQIRNYAFSFSYERNVRQHLDLYRELLSR
jgi:glycosyltransferase involved in cell wall biosynthesis